MPYRLLDLDCGGYMFNGHVYMDMEEVREQLFSWAEGEWGDGSDEDIAHAEKETTESLLELKNIGLEECGFPCMIEGCNMEKDPDCDCNECGRSRCKECVEGGPCDCYVWPSDEPTLFERRREEFVKAAIALQEAWEKNPDEKWNERYPKRLPSFDEFVAELLIWNKP